MAVHHYWPRNIEYVSRMPKWPSSSCTCCTKEALWSGLGTTRFIPTDHNRNKKLLSQRNLCYSESNPIPFHRWDRKGKQQHIPAQIIFSIKNMFPNPMNFSLYATEKIWRHPYVEALEPHPISVSMSRMHDVAYDPKSKVGPCSWER